MRILVTGGTGLIGRHLIKRIVSEHRITVLSRNTVKAAAMLGKNVDVVSTLSDVAFDQIDVVINLAGEPIANKRWTKAQKNTIEQSRWQITQSIVEGIKAAATPPHTFISGSAIGYYGRQGSVAVDESYDDCTPEFSHHLCDKWEHIALKAESENTRVCIVRTGIVLAPDGGALDKMLPAFKMGGGGPMASGKQYMSWIHIDDMVKILVELADNSSLSGVFNGTAPNPVTNREFSRVLGECLNRPHFLRLPKIALKLLMGEMSDLLIYGQNVAPKKLLEAGFTFQYPDLNLALNHVLEKNP